jgi:hypothetical protein
LPDRYDAPSPPGIAALIHAVEASERFGGLTDIHLLGQ